MKLFLTQIKTEEIVQMSQNAMEGSLILRDLTKLLKKLTSTIQAILTVKLQIRFLQQIQMRSLRKNMIYKSVITLDQQTKKKLSCQEITTEREREGERVFSGKGLAHKCSRIGRSEATNSFIYKIQKPKFDLSSDRQYDSSLLFTKHGRHPEQTFNRNIERNMWLSHREENTLDSRIYTQYDQSNRTLGILKLSGQQRNETLAKCFQTNLQSIRKPVLDLSASRICQQLPRYIAWQPDSQSVAADAFQQGWKYQFLYASPPFPMIERVLRKVQKDQTNMIIVTPSWQSQ